MRKSTTVATTCETDQNRVGRVSGRERGEPNEIIFSSVWQHIDPGLEGSVQTGWWRSWDWSVVTASRRSLTSLVPTLPPCVPPGPSHKRCCGWSENSFNHPVFCVETAFFLSLPRDMEASGVPFSSSSPPPLCPGLLLGGLGSGEVASASTPSWSHVCAA